MSKILVTGGAGFLGSHLVESLLEDGHTVVALDNLYTGKMSNLTDVLSNPLFTFVHSDIRDSIAIKSDFDQIYNLACPASPPAYQADPIMTLDTNYIGVSNVLKFAHQCGGAKVFQASTSEIYGDPLVHPQPESYWGNVNINGPRANYDEGKRVAETLITEWNRKYSLPVKIARIFNTYGPRLHKDDGRVVSNFICQALQGKDITIYGDGKQTRSFCYVSDLIKGFRLLMDTPDSYISPTNLGNPSEFFISELATKIIELTGSSSKIVYNPLPQDDPKQRKPDISRAQEVLNWTPKISLNTGLEKTIDYFKQKVSH